MINDENNNQNVNNDENNPLLDTLLVIIERLIREDKGPEARTMIALAFSKYPNINSETQALLGNYIYEAYSEESDDIEEELLKKYTAGFKQFLENNPSLLKQNDKEEDGGKNTPQKDNANLDILSELEREMFLDEAKVINPKIDGESRETPAPAKTETRTPPRKNSTHNNGDKGIQIS